MLQWWTRNHLDIEIKFYILYVHINKKMTNALSYTFQVSLPLDVNDVNQTNSNKSIFMSETNLFVQLKQVYSQDYTNSY